MDFYETFNITKKNWKTNEDIMKVTELADTPIAGSASSSE